MHRLSLDLEHASRLSHDLLPDLRVGPFLAALKMHPPPPDSFFPKPTHPISPHGKGSPSGRCRGRNPTLSSPSESRAGLGSLRTLGSAPEPHAQRCGRLLHVSSTFQPATAGHLSRTGATTFVRPDKYLSIPSMSHGRPEALYALPDLLFLRLRRPQRISTKSHIGTRSPPQVRGPATSHDCVWGGGGST